MIHQQTLRVKSKIRRRELSRLKRKAFWRSCLQKRENLSGSIRHSLDMNPDHLRFCMMLDRLKVKFNHKEQEYLPEVGGNDRRSTIIDIPGSILKITHRIYLIRLRFQLRENIPEERRRQKRKMSTQYSCPNGHFIFIRKLFIFQYGGSGQLFRPFQSMYTCELVLSLDY